MSKSTVIKGLATLALVIVVILVYTDAVLRSKFEGNRWTVPSKVYSSALELFPGKAISRDHIIYHLRQSGYVEKAVARQPGEFARTGSGLEVFRRDFQYALSSEPAGLTTISFKNNRIATLESDAGNLVLARLEPVIIGGIYPGHQEDRILVKREGLPELLVQALLVTEDKDFFQHWGVSVKGIARAMLANVKSGAVVQGGSTLTQQLVKNFFLTSERTLRRKLAEVVMSLMLEFHYSKDDILEAYANEIYLGQSGAVAIHGFGLASRYYFGRQLADLDAAQLALLVAIVKGPSYYNPRSHPERAVERRNLVLGLLEEQGHLSREQAAAAQSAPLGMASAGYSAYQYPAFMGLVKKTLQEKFVLESLAGDGTKIFSTLDPFIQKQAELALSSQLERLNRGRGDDDALQGSVIVVEPQTGDVLAMVSDRNPSASGFNRALSAYRPVGSLMKPFVYLTALGKGLNWQAGISDAPLKLELENSTWQPENFSRQSHGLAPDYIVPMLDSMKFSYNLATARLAMEVGMENIVGNLRRLGYERDVNAYPSLALGAIDMSPFDVVSLYQPVSAQGFKSEPHSLREIVDSKGEPVEMYSLGVEERLSAAEAYLLTWGMQQVVEGGTGRSLYRTLDRNINAAGKTGTSDEGRDAWFVGFTGNYLAVVWVGNDENAAAGITGASAALPVWANLMQRLSVEPLKLVPPDGVEWRWVSADGYKLSAAHCPGSVEIPLQQGSLDVYEQGCGEASKKINDIKKWFRGLFR